MSCLLHLRHLQTLLEVRVREKLSHSRDIVDVPKHDIAHATTQKDVKLSDIRNLMLQLMNRGYKLMPANQLWLTILKKEECCCCGRTDVPTIIAIAYDVKGQNFELKAVKICENISRVQSLRDEEFFAAVIKEHDLFKASVRCNILYDSSVMVPGLIDEESAYPATTWYNRHGYQIHVLFDCDQLDKFELVAIDEPLIGSGSKEGER